MPFPPIGPEWDRIALAGRAFSGLARVEGAERIQRVDAPRRGGRHGSRVTIKARDNATPTITLVGWEDGHLDELERLADLVFPWRSARHAPVTVEHPALEFHGITQVFVKKVKGPKVNDDGSFELVLETLEMLDEPAPRPRRVPAAPAAPPIDPDIQRVFTSNPLPTAPSAAIAPRRRG